MGKFIRGCRECKARGDGMREKAFYTTFEAAKILGVNPLTVWRWCKGGKIKAWRTPGGHYRIPKQELDRLLAGGEIR